MFKSIRILVLLFILAAVAMATWRAKTTAVSWKYTLSVNVFPVNGDGSDVVDRYIRGLTLDEFTPIERFMQAEAVRYGRASNASIEMRLHPEIKSVPPAPPQQGNLFDVVLWSLQLRWWTYQNAEIKGPGAQIKLFVLYFDPARHPILAHSTALQKGLIGRVNAFASADMRKQNNVIIAHEFLHTLGASDKYDMATNQPLFPIGYAEPERVPVWPQTLAEVMGGRVPLSQSEARIPLSLDEVVIGDATALEINWLELDSMKGNAK
jgi:hypothetical protein